MASLFDIAENAILGLAGIQIAATSVGKAFLLVENGKKPHIDSVHQCRPTQFFQDQAELSFNFQRSAGQLLSCSESPSTSAVSIPDVARFRAVS